MILGDENNWTYRDDIEVEKPNFALVPKEEVERGKMARRQISVTMKTREQKTGDLPELGRVLCRAAIFVCFVHFNEQSLYRNHRRVRKLPQHAKLTALRTKLTSFHLRNTGCETTDVSCKFPTRAALIALLLTMPFEQEEKVRRSHIVDTDVVLSYLPVLHLWPMVDMRWYDRNKTNI